MTGNVGVGNEAGIQFHEYLSYFKDDPSTSIIVMFVDGMRNGRKFLQVAKETSDKKPIVLRMLRNLFGIAEAARDNEGMLRYVETVVTVDPELVAERGMRAVIRFQAGRHRSALADLDWFLETKPEGVDLDRIRQMRQQFETRMQSNEPNG